MDGFGDSESSKDRQPWTLEEMLEHKEKWNLAADVGVLEYLQKFGNDLLGETENTLKLLDSFEADLNSSCIQVSNITNKFLALADSQFVENLVRDDEESPAQENAIPDVVTKTKQEEEKEVSDRLKEAISNGLNVLKTKFEMVEVANSDSEDDDSGPTGVVYKPINPFNNRPLPHLIGSVEFMKDPTVGLEDPASEEDEESIGESLSSESKALSEDNDDSEPDSDRPNTLPTNETHNDLADILYKQPVSSSFADHLTKRLEDMDNERKIKSQPQKPARSLFSTTPPPLDDSYDDEYGSSDDLIFGRHNNQKPFDDDLFVPKSNSGLWNEDRDGDFQHRRDVSNDINERRKNAMSDFEKELSKSVQKRKGYDEDDDLYNDILSPSPPPLDKQIGGSYDDLRYSDENFTKRNPSNTLFNERDYDDVSSNSLFASSEPKYSSSTNPKSESLNDQFYNQENNEYRNYKDSSGGGAIAKSISNLRRRNYSADDTDEDSVVNNDTVDTEAVNDSIFKTMTQQDVSKSSSRSSSVKMSESFQDDNLSIKSNRSAGLFDDVVTNTTKKNAIKKNMDDLFSDLNYQNPDGSDEDDLFGNNLTKGDKRKNPNINESLNSPKMVSSKTSASKATKVIDDLFGDVDNDDLFSKLSVTTKKSEPKSKIPENNKDDFMRKTIAAKEDKSLPRTSKKVTGSLFDEADDVDVFGSGNTFSNVKSSKSAVNSSDIKPVETSTNVTSSDKSKRVISLFDDMDESDLFGDGNKKGNSFESDLFGSSGGAISKSSGTRNVPYNVNKNAVPSLFADEADNNDSLFSGAIISSKDKNEPKDVNYEGNVSKNSVSKNSKEGQNRVSSDVSKENLQPDNSSGVNNINDVKTANVKHISLISDKNIETNLLFPNAVDDYDSTVKGDRNSKAVPFITDDSPLFRDNQPKSFMDVKTDGKTKALDTSETSANNDQSITDPMFEDELFSQQDRSYLVRQDEPTTMKSSTNVHNDISERATGNNPKPLIASKDAKDTSLNVQNIHSTTDQNDSHNIKRSDESSSLFDSKKATEIKFDKFDVNKSLPNIPTPIVTNKKPEVKPKPNKPEPPKSLNIRAPISVQPLHGPSGSKVASIKQSLDVTDGGVFSSEKSESSEKSSASPRTMPGKLNLEKALHIDPKALLPGARMPSFKKSSSPSETKESVVPISIKLPSPVAKSASESDKQVVGSKDLSSSETSSVQNSEPVLHSIAKDRVKIQIKRRPQTRKARREAVRQSMIDNADDDETDNSSSITTHSEREKSNPSSLFEQPSNILSPSTDEEDLFGVPPLDLPADYTKVSMSPGDIFDMPNPTIISPDFGSIETRTENRSSKYNNNSSAPKVEDSGDLFTRNMSNNTTLDDPNNRKGVRNIANVEASEDLFSNKKQTDNLRGLFDNVKPLPDDTEDLFSDVVTSKEKGFVDKTDDLFGSVKNLKGNVEIWNEHSAEKPKTLFSNIDSPDDLFQKSLDEKDKFLSEDKSKQNRGDNVFGNQKPVVNQQNERLSGSTSSKGSQIEVKVPRPETREDVDKMNIFADLDDADLFAGSNISKTTKTSAETEAMKQDPSTNVICNVFNTGVVNICDKLSVSPPNNDELFPPSDWSVSNSGNRQANKTITSVPEKIKTDSLFDDNIDDDHLFSKVPTSSKMLSLDSKVLDSSLQKRVKEDETTVDNKSRVVDSLFSNNSDNDDDVALFGEIKKKTTEKPLNVSNIIKQPMDTKQSKTSTNLKSSLFDADDGDDIFASSSSKVRNKVNTTNQSLNDIFESSGSVVQSASKKATSGGKKKISASKPSEEKANDKGNFVDPLSAFADND